MNSLGVSTLNRKYFMRRKSWDWLLTLGEFYWKQRSRSEWLKGGDRNTKFLQSKASRRRRKNEVKELENVRDEWVQEKSDVVTEMESYVCDIFSTTLPDENVIESVLEGVERRTTSDMNDVLDAPFSLEDVRKAVFQMGP